MPEVNTQPGERRRAGRPAPLSTPPAAGSSRWPVLAALLLVALWAVPVQGDTVTLRRSARVETFDEVTLQDVATLEGSYAQQFAALALTATRHRGGGPELSIAEIRQALNAAEVNWGKLSLRGDACHLRLRRALSEPEEEAEAATSGPQPIDPNGPPTLRLRVAKYISEWTGLPLADLRLSFSEHQEELLSLSERDYRFELTPIMSPDSLRIPVVVRVWREGAPQRQETVTVDIEKRVPVVVLKRDVDRETVLTAADVEVQVIWLSRSGAEPFASLTEVTGRVATKRLQAGKILRAGDLEQPILIKRRDKVRVYCLVGNLVLSTDTARAMEDGRLGEWIQLQREGGKRTFSAKVQGRGVALVEIPQPILGGGE
ncbi:MAG: flagellar basal body P-ring formation chaperone FlgA [Phycisphaerales bacterium JB038]